MSLFGLLKRSPPYYDSELGGLARSGRYWEGKVSLGDHTGVPVRIAGTRAAPDPVNLGLARELGQRFVDLMPALQNALFEHYEPYRDAVDAGEDGGHPDPVPRMASPDDVWNYVTPRFVTIEPLSSVPTVEIAYETAWDIEHTVAARFQNWALFDLCGSV